MKTLNNHILGLYFRLSVIPLSQAMKLTIWEPRLPVSVLVPMFHQWASTSLKKMRRRKKKPKASFCWKKNCTFYQVFSLFIFSGLKFLRFNTIFIHNRSQWLRDQCGLWAGVIEGSVWWIFTTLGTPRTTHPAPGTLCLGKGWPGGPWGGGRRWWGRGAWGARWARAWGGTSPPNSSLWGCRDWKPPSMDPQSVLQADPSVRHLSSAVQPLAWCSCICSWKVSYKMKKIKN